MIARQQFDRGSSKITAHTFLVYPQYLIPILIMAPILYIRLSVYALCSCTAVQQYVCSVIPNKLQEFDHSHIFTVYFSAQHCMHTGVLYLKGGAESLISITLFY